jgi:hypothetical protein
VTFVSIAETGAENYIDSKSSTDQHGVYYSYRVRAVGGPASDTVRSMYGTRITDQATPFSTEVAFSPYVIEGSQTFEENLTVAAGTSLYIGDAAELDFLAGKMLVVEGLFRVEASAQAPARFTAHAPEGETLGSTDGLQIRFMQSATPYDPASGRGTLLQNASLENLSQDRSIWIRSNIKISHVYASSLNTTGGSYVSIANGLANGVTYEPTAPIIERSSFTRMVLAIGSDGTPTPRTAAFSENFSVRGNRFRGGYYFIYLADFRPESTGFSSGQVSGNSFDGSRPLWLSTPGDSSAPVPLAGNYWAGAPGTPPVPAVGPLFAPYLDMSGALRAEPSELGPSWELPESP